MALFAQCVWRLCVQYVVRRRERQCQRQQRGQRESLRPSLCNCVIRAISTAHLRLNKTINLEQLEGKREKALACVDGTRCKGFLQAKGSITNQIHYNMIQKGVQVQQRWKTPKSSGDIRLTGLYWVLTFLR